MTLAHLILVPDARRRVTWRDVYPCVTHFSKTGAVCTHVSQWHGRHCLSPLFDGWKPAGEDLPRARQSGTSTALRPHSVYSYSHLATAGRTFISFPLFSTPAPPHGCVYLFRHRRFPPIKRFQSSLRFHSIIYLLSSRKKSSAVRPSAMVSIRRCHCITHAST